jgi:hypothetical protein
MRDMSTCKENGIKARDSRLQRPAGAGVKGDGAASQAEDSRGAAARTAVMTSLFRNSRAGGGGSGMISSLAAGSLMRRLTVKLALFAAQAEAANCS